MIRTLVSAFLLWVASATMADEPDGGIVYGGEKSDGWGLSFSVPKDWRFDCCRQATDFGANLLIFPTTWDHEKAIGVIVLNVWKKKWPTLQADWDADAADCTQHYPGAISQAFDVTLKNITCRSTVYVGTDKLRDYVAICDPGHDWNYRFAWSMLVSSNEDISRDEGAFRDVVAATRLMHVTQQ